MIICISWDWSTIWSAISALATLGLLIATIFLVVYGRGQLKTLNETNKETFLFQLKDDFFSEHARNILILIEYDLLDFKTVKINKESNKEFGFFEIKNITNEQIKDVLGNIYGQKKKLLTNELDDLLLQHFEDLGFLFRKKIITIVDAEQLFGYYVVTVFENSAIEDYIDWVRSDDKDIYSNFEYLY